MYNVAMAVALDYSTIHVLVIGGAVYYGEQLQIDWFSASTELVHAN